MKSVLFILTLLFSTVILAERNIEVLPDNVGENPPKSYSDQNKGNKKISDITDSVRLKANEALRAKSQTDSINQRLSALKNKINSHQHQLKLKTKALHTARNNAEIKIKTKSKSNRAKLKRIIGATTTN